MSTPVRHVRSIFLYLSIATLAFVSGCGNGATLNTLNFPSTLPSPKIAVAANFNSNNVSVYQVNATTGALTEVSGSPFASPINPYGITVHPNGQWVYVASDDDNTIQGWSVNNTTGALTAINTVTDSDFVDWVTGITTTADGNWVLTADCNGNISVFSVNQTTGALTAAASSPTAVLGLSPRPCLNTITVVGNQFVYAGDVDNNTDNLASFSFNDTTGALTPIGSPLTVPASIFTSSSDQNGQFLYVGGSDGNLYGYTINPSTGALTSIATGFPVTLANAPSAQAYQMVFDPLNRFAYVADDNTDVQVFAFNTGTGALTPITGSPFDSQGASPQGLAVDPSGQFLYVTNYNGNTLAAYTINQVTGAPTPISASPYTSSGSGVNSIVITH